ncbi:1283_t:CDS:2 [Ambispora gerdemannii]|uniref:1283_t:CDS:1 n=1 Tax=Ambispora gerdemannii TaxID=144530 RepID=A0A9N9BG35_9GLOM|nr:1283_t:CDS:2 [Ambispora gerdemannii]
MPPKKPESATKHQQKITDLLTVGKREGDEKPAAPGLKTQQKKKKRQAILEETSKSDTKRNLEKESEVVNLAREIPLKKEASLRSHNEIEKESEADEEEDNVIDVYEEDEEDEVSHPSPPSEIEEDQAKYDKIRASKTPSFIDKHTSKLTFHDEHLTPEQKLLHAFDLNYGFGSCVGVTRLERWERAKRLGLNPPEEIKKLLMAENADDPEIKESLFYGRCIMVSTPPPLAVVTRTSGSLTTARKRVLQLYRDWQRAAPKVVKLYLLDYPASAVRAKIRQEFERNRYVNDLAVIDVLLLKGRNEFNETLNQWKQPTHVYQYFEKEAWVAADREKKGFLERFYGGRD